MKSLKNNLFEIDGLIKAARWEEAQKMLTSLRRKPIAREFATEFAALCRRASVPELGISVLRPIVRPTSRKVVEAPAAGEIIEYAANLGRLGACREATKLLKPMASKPSPEVAQVLASIYVKEWRYPEAIPLYREYLRQPELAEYSRQVGYLNLCLCLIFEDKLREAAAILAGVLESKEASAHFLIRANALRLLGLIHFQKLDFGMALEHFNEALNAFPPANGIDRFLVEKWIGIVHYIIQNANSESLRRVKALKKEALEWKHWESLRDIEYQLACHHRDEEKLVQIYFGTPFESFRARIKKRFPALRLPALFKWRPSGKKSDNGVLLFNLETSGLKPGQSSHRLLATLSSDFYRPFSTIDLFERLFPQEYYDSGTSEQRVYQIASRTRRWLEESKIPLQIDSTVNQMKIQETEPCALVLRLDNSVTNQDNHRLRKIREKLGEIFSAKEAANLLGLNKRTVLNLLNRAVSEKEVLKEGESIGVKYRFPSDEASQKKVS